MLQKSRDTYCDVERVIVKWVRDSGVKSLYRERLAEEIKAKELAEKARLEAKYPELKESPIVANVMAKGNVAECVDIISPDDDDSSRGEVQTATIRHYTGGGRFNRRCLMCRLAAKLRF